MNAAPRLEVEPKLLATSHLPKQTLPRLRAITLRACGALHTSLTRPPSRVRPAPVPGCSASTPARARLTARTRPLRRSYRARTSTPRRPRGSLQTCPAEVRIEAGGCHSIPPRTSTTSAPQLTSDREPLQDATRAQVGPPLTTGGWSNVPDKPRGQGNNPTAPQESPRQISPLVRWRHPYLHHCSSGRPGPRVSAGTQGTWR